MPLCHLAKVFADNENIAEAGERAKRQVLFWPRCYDPR